MLLIYTTDRNDWRGNYDWAEYAYDPATGNMSSKAGWVYTYGDAAHKHAVTALSTGNTYGYDSNGNMITRTVNQQTYQYGYDPENRMTSVSGAAQAQFTYNGDGQRVIATEGVTTTLFVGDYFEYNVTASEITKYYFAGGVRLAMQRGSGGVKFILGDHLGSASVTLNADGTLAGEHGYYPWGPIRFTAGSIETEYTFTGQFSYRASFGLMYYRARWYSTELGRFAQPDTVIPDLYNSLDYDRYQYVRSNPIIFMDPGGHIPLLGTALLGFAIGGSVNIAFQLVALMNNGMTIDEAMKCIDWAQVGGSAVGGLVFGATLGLGTAALGTGYAATAASGAMAGILGGQANILTDSGINTLFEDQGFNATTWIENAIGMGLFDAQTMKFDAAAGAIVGVAGKALSDLVTKAITSVLGPSNHNYGVPVIKLFKDKMYIEISGRPGLSIEQTAFEKIRLLIALGLWDQVREILEEVIKQGVKNWQPN